MNIENISYDLIKPDYCFKTFSEKYIIVNLKYNKGVFLLKTPKLLNIYGYSNKYNNTYASTILSISDIDKTNIKFYNNFIQMDKFISSNLQKLIRNVNCNFKDMKYQNSFDKFSIKVYYQPNTKVFDNENNLRELNYMTPNCIMNSLFHISHLLINLETETTTLIIRIIQCKVYTQFLNYTKNCIFDDNMLPPPKAPPPPPPPPPASIYNVSKLTIRKNNKNKTNTNKKKTSCIINKDELLLRLSNLKKVDRVWN